MTVCNTCGLPKEICVCGTMAKEEAKIKIYKIQRKFRKFVTMIEGIEENANPKDVMKKLKTKLACGGTYKDGKIEVQGDHVDRVKTILISIGFPAERIETD